MLDNLENEEMEYSVDISKIMDYIYCPRIVYYEDVLGIPSVKKNEQKLHEEMKIKEKKGNLILRRFSDNLRAKSKGRNIFMTSKENHFHGKLDEILVIKKEDLMVPLYFKDWKYDGRLYEMYKYETAMFSMMIEENFDTESKRGYMVFLRNGINDTKRLVYSEEDFEKIRRWASETRDTITTGKYPIKVEAGKKCKSCYYKTICTQ